MKPLDEAARLTALGYYEILDAEAEELFDSVARLAAQVCSSPMALVNFVQDDRQWFKARFGVEMREAPAQDGFCLHTLDQDGVLVVEDALADPRFAEDPFVKGDLRIRFYAGAPLLTADRIPLGTLCVLDRVPRHLAREQRDALATLARAVMDHLELRRRAAEAASVQIERDQLFELAPVGLVVYGRDAEPLDANPSALEFLGLTPQSLRKIKTYKEIHEDGTPFAEGSHPVERALKTGAPVKNVLMGIDQPGGQDPSWMLVNALPEKDLDGNVNRVLCTLADVTERKLAEEDLSNSFDLSVDLLCILDSFGVFQRLNRAWEKALGYTLDELRERRFVDFVHPDDRERADAEYARLLSGERMAFLDTRYLKKDGSFRWLQWNAVAGKETRRIYALGRDVTDRKVAEEQLQHAALHDPLTGVLNRAGIVDRLGRLFLRARRRKEVLAVLYLDLDNFKEVNDHLGHLTGDVVLAETARRVEAAVRPGDLVGRHGGDEFLIVLVDVGSGPEALSVAQRIHEALHRPLEIEGQEVGVRASIGIAVSRDDHPGPLDVLRDADVALYRAKAAGKGRSVLFEAS